MSHIKSGYDTLRMARKGNKRDVLTIHPETAQRIRITALENYAKLDTIERHQEIRRLTASIQGSLAEEVVAERDERG
jgi:hypothetical protein